MSSKPDLMQIAGESTGDYRQKPNSDPESEAISSKNTELFSNPALTREPFTDKDAYHYYNEPGSAKGKTPETSPSKKAGPDHKAELRDLFNRLTEQARRETELMIKFAEEDDPIQLAIAGHSLQDTLRDLLSLRSIRDDDWPGLLSTLIVITAKEVFEQYSVEKCRVLNMVIAKYLSLSHVDIDDLMRSRKHLKQAGFNLWKALAGPIEESE